MSIYISSGEVSCGIVLSYDSMHIYSGGTASTTTLNLSGYLHVSNGGVANETTVNRGYLYVSNGGVANETTVFRGGMIFVSSGGVVDRTILNGDSYGLGVMRVSSGGTANATTVNNDGVMVASPGGAVSKTTVNGGGNLYVSSGGSANGIILNSGAGMDISSGIAANSITVNGYGCLRVSSGGTVVAVRENGGYVHIADGANATFVANSFSGLILNGCSATLHSGTTANSTTVNSDGRMFVYSGGEANSITVNSMGSIYVNTGGVANATTVNSYGRMYINSGGVANSTIVNSHGRMYVNSGTTANATTVNSDGSMYVSIGGVANSTTVNSGGKLFVSSGGEVNSITVNSGGKLYVSSGGEVNSITVNSGGGMVVSSGGCARDVTISTGGRLGGFSWDYERHWDAIENGSAAVSDNVVIIGHQMYVSNGGVANSTTVNTGGMMYVKSGGTANSATVNSSGYLYVYSGGTANETTVNSRGYLYVSSGASALVITENGGYVKIADGASATFVANCFSGQVLSNGQSATVHSGTTANSVTVNWSGCLEVCNGGTATVVYNPWQGTILHSAGAAVTYLERDANVYYGGVLNGFGGLFSKGNTLSGLTVNYASALVYSGGTATSTVVSMYGSMYVYSGGVANETIVNDDGSLFVASGGTATIVYNPWQGKIYSSAGASITYLERDANVYYGHYGLLSRGDSLSGLALNYLCYALVYSGGTVNSTSVNYYGYLYVSNGGVANSTTVNSDGGMYVSSGGKVTGTLTIAYGAVVSAYAGSIIDFDISTANPEDAARVNYLLRVEGAPNYTVTVSASQAPGEYRLANGAAGFDKTITVNIGTGDTLGTLVVGGKLEYGDDIYSLRLNDSLLTLTVESGDIIPPDKPVAAADTTAPTNRNVTVTAIFSEDSVEKQYSLNRENWQNYTTGVVMADNGTVYFRGIDEAGNISDVTSYTVSNIDKVAPVITLTGDNISAVHQTTLSASADDGSTLYYRIDGGAQWLEYTAPLTVNTNATYEFKATDMAGNTGTALLAFANILPAAPEDLVGTKNGLSWTTTGAERYIVEYSTDDFEHVISVVVSSNGIDSLELPSGTYSWRIRAAGNDEWKQGESIVSDNADTVPKVISPTANGNGDVFFANASGTWTAGYAAKHVGSIGDWNGTEESVSAIGKNRFHNLFFGSTDANILLLTDDANGDAIFVDDIYTELPGTVSQQQSRIARIREIRAGTGDDIVDMTSQRFEYIGDGLTIRGGSGNDTLWANKGDNMLFGDAGDDHLVGASGNDVLVGGIGYDSMHGGGGTDIFAFCENWGNDTVEQLADGAVTLWLASGNLGNWNASTLTYTDGRNSVTVTGTDNVTLKFGNDGSGLYATLSDAGAFAEFTSEKIFEERGKGILASL